jgi:ferredoxin
MSAAAQSLSEPVHQAIIIAEASDGRRSEMHVSEGSAVIDACDAHDAPVPFCCRSAACGTCRVEIIAGAEHLQAPQQDELELLHAFDVDPKHVRLACQLRLRLGPARVHLKVVEE